jgi:hypothetical protein
MGGGTYSVSARKTRAVVDGYYTKSAQEIFSARSINNAMNPHGVKIRESRDSEEHPESLAIIIALDVTGSMGSVPHHLIKDGLPSIMDGIIKAGVKDPQVLFLAIGDHECDDAPLQVGQFESSDELLDKWLTDTYIESGGGGNEGESYLLAWYFAANHTSIDCFEKRGQKGFLFTIGDEPTLKEVPSSSVKSIMGLEQPQKHSADDLLRNARDKYNVYHLHIKETAAGGIKETIDGWKQLIRDSLVEIKNHTDVSSKIAEIITGNKKVESLAEQKDEIIL